MKETNQKGAYRRLMVVALRGEGKRNAEIAKIVGIHRDSVGKIVKRFVLDGIDTLLEDGRKGGNNRNMSYEEEEALLEPFKQAALSGQIVEVSEIKSAYEKAIGRSLKNAHGHIYRVLRRHGWRKVMPRSKHPNKASDEAIEASKKLTTQSDARWKIIPQERFV
jgi:transposase